MSPTNLQSYCRDQPSPLEVAERGYMENFHEFRLEPSLDFLKGVPKRIAH